MDDLELAAALVRDAGSLAARMLAEGLETKYKTSVSDVVSAADEAAERLVVSRLTEQRPGDALVGEEGTRRDGGGAAGEGTDPGSGRTWYVDPVDGTYNFLSHLPYWCSAVGLADEQGPYAAAVYYPARDELWTGGRDHPTELNGRPVGPLADRPLAEVSVATYSHPRHFGDAARLRSWQAVTGSAATIRMLGSASVDLAGVATSRLGLFLQADLYPWDWVPGAALVLGAAGRAERLTVGAQTWHLAGNAQAVEDAVTALRAVG